MAYPNKTSQSLHTLKINKVPDEATFEQMQTDNLVNANELYLIEGAPTVESDPIFSASAAAEITASDITNWNNKVSDDKTWNGVSLTKSSSSGAAAGYVPYVTATTATSASYYPVAQASTPTANSIPKYTSSGYLTSTTPSANDNTTKVATTAFVKTAIGNISYPVTSVNGNTGAVTISVPTVVSALTNDSGYVTQTDIDNALSGLTGPMKFKGSLGTGGSISTLPAAADGNKGDTYKVITAGTYQGVTAKIGDVLISDGSAWVLIPSGDEPSGTVTSITLKANSPISIDSTSAITTSGTRTLSHADSGVTAGTYKSVTVDSKGHVTAGSNPSETDPIFTGSAAYGISSSDITNWDNKSDFSGSYNDLTDKPTIPAAVTESTVSGWGFTKNTGTVTSVRVQATSPVQSSTSTAQSTTLNTTISLADGYGDTKNPYASKTKNYVLAAPNNANGTPSFRALTAADIPSLTVSKISDFPTIPTKTSDLTNDSGFLTSFTETDPTVPSWAKASTKPTYTASEVGAAASNHTHSKIGYYTGSGDGYVEVSTNRATIEASTNGGSTQNTLILTGTTTTIHKVVTPTADGDAANKKYVDDSIPTKISDLTNDSGFLTSESDPVFTASAAHGITSTNITNWNNKISEPASEGTNGQVLMTNGNGTRTWGSVSTADEKIKLTSQSTSGNYPLIFGPTSITNNSTYQGYYNTGITINPNTKAITATTFVGALTGTASGNLTSSSTLDASKLSGTIPSGVKAATQDSSDNSTKIATTAFVKNNLGGLSGAMHFKGTTTTALTDGTTTAAVTINSSSYTPSAGDVVLYSDSEFVWTGTAWERLGRDSSFKVTQSTVSDPTANGSTTAFIDTISQNANGVISVTKKNLDTSGAWSGSAAKLTTARSLKTKLDSTTAITFDGSAAQDAIPVTGTLPIGNGGTGATTAKAARENLGAAPTPFVAGTQTASTNVWTGALPSNVTEYYNGLTIDYFLPYAGTNSAATLNLGGLGAKPVYVGNAATTAVTTHFPANSVLHLTYIVNSALNSGNGCWKVSAYQNSTYNYESCYVSTSASTAAKVGTLTNYALQPGYLQVAIYNANTAASALTLNINSTGAKPIYINGAASSSSNYTLPKGMYMVHYDGTKYDFRTDGFIDTYTNTIIGNSNSYGETLPASGTTGQIFFQTSDPYYELPAGGSTGQVLIKNSNNDRDVIWGSAGSALPAQSGNSGKFLTTNGTTASWANVTLSDYVQKSGDTMTGNLIVNNNSGIESQIKAQNGAGIIYLYSQTSSTGGRGIYGYNASDTGQSMFSWPQDGTIHAGGQLYGAVWNDYAEYRQADSTEPGRCVVEKGDDTLTISSKRMQPGAEIISDTFGFAIGQTEKAQTPIATSGRVLAYPYESLEEFKNAIGRPVCSGPNGTVSIMTNEEYQKFGYCAIGTISAVPEYETWGENNIAVNNRVWIRVR